jgi:LacI family gluconate utilization system Gnt-I transcriptional repressor
VDVARIARVSPITVSRALNAPERVSPKALERVQKAVKRTGYVPNLLAGGLRSAKSRLVAAVVPTISGPVFQGMIQALTDALDERGYQLLIGQSGYKTSREDALLDAIIGRRPIGIVLTGMMHSVEGRRRLLAAGIPVVETWDLSKPAIDMTVGFSHEAVGEAVCEYLFRKGRRRFAVLSGDDERGARRTNAFVAAAARFGLPSPVVKWVAAPTTLAGGREGLAELLQREAVLDAVSCSSDLLALGVLTEAHARRVAVPERLAVIGFGNLPFAAGVIPALSTVHIDGVRIGRTAAELIITRATGEKVEHSWVDVSFSIIQRDSA